LLDNHWHQAPGCFGRNYITHSIAAISHIQILIIIIIIMLRPWYYGDKERLAEVEQMVLEDATVAWVLEKIKVTDEAVSFKDVMDAA
jgi:hypothetical protein